YVFFFSDPPTTSIYTLSLHDALPISDRSAARGVPGAGAVDRPGRVDQPAASPADRAGGRRRAGAASRLPAGWRAARGSAEPAQRDRKSTRLNSSHVAISYAVFCLKKK